MNEFNGNNFDNEQKNNAIEKVENITTDNVKKEQYDINQASIEANEHNKQIEDDKKHEKIKLTAEQKQEMREEKAKQKANAKIKKAKASAEKKEEHNKHKIEKQQAENKKRIEHKKAVIRQKQAKKNRKELIKNESPTERVQRIATEKNQKLQLKKQKAQSKANLKVQKLQDKKENKERKALLKAEDRRRRAQLKAQDKERKAILKSQKSSQRASRGIGGWLAAVISLGCVTLILGSMLTVMLFTNGYMLGTPVTTEASARHAFYDFVGYVDNIDVNMSKILVAEDRAEQQRLLTEIRVQGNLANNSLQELPLHDENKYHTSKFINQLADYAKVLNEKLIAGNKITPEEYELLEKLTAITTSLKMSLADLANKIDDSYSFMTLMEDDKPNIVIDQFMQLESNSVDYPQMIYDGPFSDGLESREVKGLKGKEINENDAKQVVDKIFSEYGIKNCKVEGVAEAGELKVYNVIGMTVDGELYAQVSKKDGKLIMFNSYSQCKDGEYNEEQSIAIAEKFLQLAGITGMKAVWVNNTNNIASINFAYEHNGVIVYSDLVKVSVCLSKGRVIGMEANTYYINHTARADFSPTKTIDEARAKVSDKIKVQTARLAIVPVGNGGEKLAYEFMGKYKNDTYYVYIDAENLHEIDIFKVVATTEGQLLL